MSGEMSNLDALQMTVEDGTELLTEHVVAFAGPFGSRLRPCRSECPGHFDEFLTKLFRLGLDRYAEVSRMEERWRTIESAAISLLTRMDGEGLGNKLEPEREALWFALTSQNLTPTPTRP